MAPTPEEMAAFRQHFEALPVGVREAVLREILLLLAARARLPEWGLGAIVGSQLVSIERLLTLPRPGLPA